MAQRPVEISSEVMVPQNGDQPDSGTESTPIAVPDDAAGAERPPKRKTGSGYSRLRSRHRTLIEAHERLQQSHDRLEQDFRQLEAAFEEVTHLNAQLAAELRAAKQRPVQYGAHMLMGT
jgi:hypothetical protein